MLEGDIRRALYICLSICVSHFWGFHTFADKLLIRLSSNLVGKLTIRLRSDKLMVMFCCIPPISWTLDSFSSLCAFSDKLLIRLTSYLVGELIMEIEFQLWPSHLSVLLYLYDLIILIFCHMSSLIPVLCAGCPLAASKCHCEDGKWITKCTCRRGSHRGIT